MESTKTKTFVIFLGEPMSIPNSTGFPDTVARCVLYEPDIKVLRSGYKLVLIPLLDTVTV